MILSVIYKPLYLFTNQIICTLNFKNVECHSTKLVSLPDVNFSFTVHFQAFITPIGAIYFTIDFVRYHFVNVVTHFFEEEFCEQS